jgi:hypothetical protein
MALWRQELEIAASVYTLIVPQNVHKGRFLVGLVTATRGVKLLSDVVDAAERVKVTE